MLLTDRALPLRAGHRGIVGAVLALLAAMLLASGCASRPEAPPWKVSFTTPALSPDGRLVAVRAWVRGHRGSRLAVIDLETGAVRTFAPPTDQIWHAPSFSPSGDRLVFMRNCTVECTSGPNGFHIGILDLRTGRDTTASAARTSHLIRVNPVFAPGGRFVVYGTVWIKDVNQRRFPKSILSRAYGFRTDAIYMLDLETGVETNVLLGNRRKLYLRRVHVAGFLDEKTLIVRSGGSLKDDLQEQLIKRVRHLEGTTTLSPEDGDYLYRIDFDRSFAAATGTPTAGALSILETDWVRPVGFQRIAPRAMISFDTGRMAFIDRSERNRQSCLFCTWEYDVFVGDRKAVRQVTFFHRRFMTGATISKSGNRVAFLAALEGRAEGVWIHDISSGRTWEAEMEKSLTAAFNSGSGRN